MLWNCLTVLPKITEKSNRAKDNFAMRRARRGDRNRARAKSGGRGARLHGSGLRVGLRDGKRQSNGETGNGGVAATVEEVGAAAPLRG